MAVTHADKVVLLAIILYVAVQLYSDVGNSLLTLYFVTIAGLAVSAAQGSLPVSWQAAQRRCTETGLLFGVTAGPSMPSLLYLDDSSLILFCST